METCTKYTLKATIEFDIKRIKARTPKEEHTTNKYLIEANRILTCLENNEEQAVESANRYVKERLQLMPPLKELLNWKGGNNNG